MGVVLQEQMMDATEHVKRDLVHVFRTYKAPTLSLNVVVYPVPADKYSSSLPTRLSRVDQPVIRTPNGFSVPLPTQLACI
jgi:hypothetical protein